MRTLAVILIGFGALVLGAQTVAVFNEAVSPPHVVVGFVLLIGGAALYAVRRPVPPT